MVFHYKWVLLGLFLFFLLISPALICFGFILYDVYLYNTFMHVLCVVYYADVSGRVSSHCCSATWWSADSSSRSDPVCSVISYSISTNTGNTHTQTHTVATFPLSDGSHGCTVLFRAGMDSWAWLQFLFPSDILLNLDQEIPHRKLLQLSMSYIHTHHRAWSTWSINTVTWLPILRCGYFLNKYIFSTNLYLLWHLWLSI